MRRVILLLVSITAAGRLMGASPVVSLEQTAVTASGVLPGARVIFYSVALEPLGYESRVLRWAESVTDDDGDGVVTLDLRRPVPWKSIWVVAELPGGRFTVAAPDGFPLNSLVFLPNVFRRGSAGQLNVFVNKQPFLDLLYIHPGGGAWILRAADGYPSDRDGRSDGVTTIALDQLQPLPGAGSRPLEFLPGGVLVAVDLMRMEVSALRLDGAVLTGATREPE